MIFIMFYCNMFCLFFFKYCASENMSNYKLLSNTPIRTYCPDDLKNIYKIFEKHPDMKNIAMCCGTRISHNFLLSEQDCFEQYDTKYITARSCKNISNIFPAQDLYRQDEKAKHGVLILKISAGMRDNSTIDSYYKFFIDYNKFFSDNINCTIYGTSTQVEKEEKIYYTKWTTVLNNTVTVSKDCRNIENVSGYSVTDKWICPVTRFIQFCDEDIGCPMVYDGNQLIGIASQRYNWRTWGLNMNCGNLDVDTRYLYLNEKIVKWIKYQIRE